MWCSKGNMKSEKDVRRPHHPWDEQGSRWRGFRMPEAERTWCGVAEWSAYGHGVQDDADWRPAAATNKL